MFKKFVQYRIERLTKRYFKVHPEVKLIVVAGSIGKTTTKNAIATLLDQKFRVGGGLENHNSELSAPLAILGIKYPDNIKSISGWLKVIKAAKIRIKESATVDIIVQEIGTDRPGDIKVFSRYLKPDIAVVTAVTPEHMLFFKDIDNVAQEELSVIDFSNLAIINRDDIDGRYAKYVSNSNLMTYGSSQNAENNFVIEDFSLTKGYSGTFRGPKAGDKGIKLTVKVFGEQSLKPVVGAVTVALEMGMSPDEIKEAVKDLRPTAGRMNILNGLRGTILIDDTYNSSPVAAREAMRFLYSLTSTQKIAVLGSMNELGETSAKAHQDLGELCNPNFLDWVITVGDEAETYLAPVAKSKGCQVKSFKTSIEAGGFVNSILKAGGVALFKGSQNRIFTEEALKIVLASLSDHSQLVRQSPDWMSQKTTFFEQSINKQKDSL